MIYVLEGGEIVASMCKTVTLDTRFVMLDVALMVAAAIISVTKIPAFERKIFTAVAADT
jgi:hypothetical protein